MLTYNYVYDSGNHRTIISSNSLQANIAIYINGVFTKFVAPNLLVKGTGAFSFTKKFLAQANKIELMHSGTIKNYDDIRLDRLLFSSANYIYIKNGDGNYLYRNPAVLDEYEWHATSRTKFFFNPHFWDCDYLWKTQIGYLPTSVTLTNQWPINDAITFFSKRTLTVTDTWVGWQSINTIEPENLSYFTNHLTGTDTTYELSHLIDLGASSGDEVLLTNGKDRLSFTYNPVI